MLKYTWENTGDGYEVYVTYPATLGGMQTEMIGFAKRPDQIQTRINAFKRTLKGKTVEGLYGRKD